jgi:hypothetical protein
MKTGGDVCDDRRNWSISLNDDLDFASWNSPFSDGKSAAEPLSRGARPIVARGCRA